MGPVIDPDRGWLKLWFVDDVVEGYVGGVGPVGTLMAAMFYLQFKRRAASSVRCNVLRLLVTISNANAVLSFQEFFLLMYQRVTGKEYFCLLVDSVR